MSDIKKKVIKLIEECDERDMVFDLYESGKVVIEFWVRDDEDKS